MMLPFRSYVAATNPALDAVMAPLLVARPRHGVLAILRWQWTSGLVVLRAHRRLARTPWERAATWCDTAVFPLAMAIYLSRAFGVALRVRWARQGAYLLAAGGGNRGRGLLVLGAFWLKGQCEWVMGARSSRPTLTMLEAEMRYDLEHDQRTSEAERFALRFPPPTGAHLN